MDSGPPHVAVLKASSAFCASLRETTRTGRRVSARCGEDQEEAEQEEMMPRITKIRKRRFIEKREKQILFLTAEPIATFLFF